MAIIKTYPEMNKTIKDLLRLNDEPMDQYILARIEELEKQVEALTPPPNDPLTLEELRKMNDGTVWVESQEQSKSGWALAGKRNCIHFRAGFSFNDYGKTWLAYRRKPEVCER